MPEIKCTCRQRREEELKLKGLHLDRRLGTILKKLSLLDDAQLEQALKAASRTAMPLGTVLLASGVLTKEELRAVLQAQSLLKDKLLDEEALLLAMPYLKNQPMGLEGALKRIKWSRDRSKQSNRLGELLLAAKVISQLQLAKGLAHHRNSLQPLGHILALLGGISERSINFALEIQEKIRTGLMTRKEGIDEIKQSCNAFNDPHQLRTVEPTEPTRLGDLLIDSGLLKEDEVRFALDVSERKSKLIGEVFVELGILSKAQVTAVLDVQRLLRCGLIVRRQAISTLQSMDKPTNLIKALEKTLAEEIDKRNGDGEALNALTAHMDKRIRGIVHRLYDDVLNGSLNFEQAMLILNLCIKDDCTVPEAVAMTSWTINVHPGIASKTTGESELTGWLTA